MTPRTPVGNGSHTHHATDTPDSYPFATGNGLTPSARQSARSRLSAIESSDEFDALTDLFLGEIRSESGPSEVSARAPGNIARRASAQPAPNAAIVEPAEPVRVVSANVPRRQPTDTLVECLVIGHVPVLASAWASQYAREVARASGKPVAMVRLRSGFVSLEIVDDPSGNGLPSDLEQHTSADLGEAVRRAGAITARWIVQAEPGIESALAASPGVRLITLLTGADEAARVAGYGAVKRLSEHLPVVKPGDPAPMIRVATVGVTGDKGVAAGQKIVEAVRQFLGRDAQQAACTQRVKSARASRVLFMGENETAPVSLLEMIENAGPPTVHVVDQPLPEDPEAIERAAVVEETVVESTEDVAAEDAPSPAARAQSRVFDEPDACSTGNTPEPMAAQAPARNDSFFEVDVRSRSQQAPTLREQARSLVSHVDGLARLSAICPVAKGVEIAMDDRGGLHVLADGRGAEWQIHQALADVLVAASWIDAYAPLVVPIGGNMKPQAVMHLLVDQPKHAKRLLDTNVRVHLVVSVEVGGQTGTACVELNGA